MVILVVIIATIFLCFSLTILMEYTILEVSGYVCLCSRYGHAALASSCENCGIGSTSAY